MVLDVARIDYARIWNTAASTEHQTFFRSLGMPEYASTDWNRDGTNWILDDTVTCLLQGVCDL